MFGGEEFATFDTLQRLSPESELFLYFVYFAVALVGGRFVLSLQGQLAGLHRIGCLATSGHLCILGMKAAFEGGFRDLVMYRGVSGRAGHANCDDDVVTWT